MPRHRSSEHLAGPSQRQLRVGEVLRHAIADILSRGEIRDPDLDGIAVTVTQVKPSADLRHAVIYCEPLGGRNADRVIVALNRHRGFVRGLLGHAIRLKFTPELRFVEDVSFAEAQKIETLLKSPRVRRDLIPGRGGDSGDGT
ncbi:MAG TPA: 30S ribosome-binding factor RbfA [Rhizomicrobium sp.]|jgi:ribosome-binding factor A|nr:30S ribosome-binding factor RbfA [Rhizomicrobium sp.]